jgi:DNA-binding NarL/FixJ family response regulator
LRPATTGGQEGAHAGGRDSHVPGSAAPGSSAAREGDDRPDEDDLSLDRLLTAREIEILEMMAEGATNQEIADRLVIALSTVKSHVRNVLSKLGVRNRTQAVALFLRG